MADFWSSVFGTKAPSVANQPTNITAPADIKMGTDPLSGGPSTVTGQPTNFTGGQIAQVQPAPTASLLSGIGTPTAANINVNTGAGSMTGYQNSLAQQLATRAAGQGPSLAQMTSDQQRQANQANIMSQLASSRGPANPLAARSAMQANVAGNAQLDRDTMAAKLQEQQAAQSQLGTLTTQGRGQDIQQATSQAQLNQQAGLTGYQTQAEAQQQMALAQYQGQLQQAMSQGQLDETTATTMFNQAQENSRLNAQMGQAFNDSRLKYTQMGLDADKANQLAAIDVERLRQSGQVSQATLQQQQQQANKQLFGGLISGASGALGMFGSKGGGGGTTGSTGTNTDGSDGSVNTAGPDTGLSTDTTSDGTVDPTATMTS